MTAERLPSTAMRASLVALAALVAVLAAGCGGSSGGGNDWQVLDQAKFTANQAAYLHSRVGRPSDLQVKIESSPSVKTTTHYSVACSNNASVEDTYNRPGPAGTTPLTAVLPLPDGPPGGCVFTLLATKSKPASMTVTLLTREVG
jgi:hypothetical protein